MYMSAPTQGMVLGRAEGMLPPALAAMMDSAMPTSVTDIDARNCKQLHILSVSYDYISRVLIRERKYTSAVVSLGCHGMFTAHACSTLLMRLSAIGHIQVSFWQLLQTASSPGVPLLVVPVYTAVGSLKLVGGAAWPRAAWSTSAAGLCPCKCCLVMSVWFKCSV